MTDTPPPKRRFWQMHLSTAVVLMVVAGPFLAANTRSVIEDTDADVYGRLGYEQWGWPITICYRRVRFEPTTGQTVAISPIHMSGDPTFCFVPFGNTSLDGIIFDVMVALLAIGVATLGCECFIRCRSKP